MCLAMSRDPLLRYAQGYATGLPLIGVGGLPDPYSQAGVHDREVRERHERREAAAVPSKHGLRAYPRVSRQRSDDLDYSR